MTDREAEKVIAEWMGAVDSESIPGEQHRPGMLLLDIAPWPGPDEMLPVGILVEEGGLLSVAPWSPSTDANLWFGEDGLHAKIRKNLSISSRWARTLKLDWAAAPLVDRTHALAAAIQEVQDD